MQYEFLIYQLNVNNIYLNSDLDEEIYMKILSGYSVITHGKMLRLTKNLYDFKQFNRI